MTTLLSRNCPRCGKQPCECGILFPELRLGPILQASTLIRFAHGKVQKVGTIVVHERSPDA